MSWHDVLVTLEQATIWATIGGLIATLFALLHRRPLKRLLGLLDTRTPGGLGDLVQAIEDTQPPPDPPRKQHGRS